MPRRRSAFRFLLGFLLILLLAFLTRALWLPWFGRVLVRDDGPGHADLAVVLAGDFYGHRIRKAGDLVRQGYVPLALISGPEGMYGVHECELAISFAVKHGYPESSFTPFRNDALSTQDEARLVLAELRRRNVHSFLLVTSNFHTARAARIFRAQEKLNGGGPDFRVVSTPDEFFTPDTWWHRRQSQKIVFFEWCKTFATAVGM